MARGKKDMDENDSGLRLDRIKPATNVFFNAWFALLSFIIIVPFIFVIMISISSTKSIAEHGYQLWPSEFSLAAYAYLWGERVTILRSLGVSVIVVVLGTVLALLLNSSLGYVLSRKSYKLRGFLVWLAFIPMIFNGGMVASYVVNANLLHLRNTIWILILPICASPFNIIICRTFFQHTIPDSVVESAVIDGSSQLRIYAQMILPLSKPVLATIALFTAFGYWNDWFFASLYIADKNLLTLQALLNNIQRSIDFIVNNPTLGVSLMAYKASMPSEAVRMAITIIVIVPIAMAYPFFQRYFISGLTIGSVKG
ncbi:MAG: carbohydrate ABC transporter permease [Clostridiales bacterium]|jgi:putative aldouronate transport system permease protein|nr:carbohydrate ABC transporter permease [Clostridiales bacterium]